MKLLLFGNPTCAPCFKAKTVLTSENIPFTYVDTFEEPELSGQHMVMSTPTVLLLDENGVAEDRVSGGDAVIEFARKYQKELI